MVSMRVLNIIVVAGVSAGLLAMPARASDLVVYFFKGGPSDGANPTAGLVDVGGTLYGTTVVGGADAHGTVFKVKTGGGADHLLHSFKGGPGDGAGPLAGLIDVGGTLYSTANGGGAHDSGTVFRITTAGGGYKVLYSFKGGNDGATPDASLINVGGTLYGTTFNGGTHGKGTVFKVTP